MYTNRTETDSPSMKTHHLKKNANGTWTATRKEIHGGRIISALTLVHNVSLDAASDALERDGVIADEIDAAVEEMFKNDHNFAEFGMMGGFIFSKFEGHLQ